MCALMAGAVLNVALDPVFIYTPRPRRCRCGHRHSPFPDGLPLVYPGRLYPQEKKRVQLQPREPYFSREILSEILKIGIPTLVFQLLTSLSISMINDAAKDYGASAWLP